MTTEVATRESPWASWDQKMKFAETLVKTGFLPKAITTPAQALAIILTGQELDIPPMHSLRSIHVIEGKPTLSSELMLALMLRGGVVCTWLESDDQRATLRAKRGNTEFTGTFELEDAKRAKLTGKIGWQFYPEAMLRARVIALVARVVAPDLIAGLYTPEELGADVDAEGTIVGEPEKPATEEKPTDQPVRSPNSIIEGVVGIEEQEDVTEEEQPTAPIDEWLQAIADAKTAKSLHAVWKGCTAHGLWATWSPDEQARLIAAKDVAKQMLGIG
jgi:hypothetical protein